MTASSFAARRESRRQGGGRNRRATDATAARFMEAFARRPGPLKDTVDAAYEIRRVAAQGGEASQQCRSLKPELADQPKRAPAWPRCSSTARRGRPPRPSRPARIAIAGQVAVGQREVEDASRCFFSRRARPSSAIARRRVRSAHGATRPIRMSSRAIPCRPVGDLPPPDELLRSRSSRQRHSPPMPATSRTAPRAGHVISEIEGCGSARR